MRSGRPSFTARAVAAARAIAGVDKAAAQWLSGPLRWLVVAGRIGGAPLLMNVASLGLVDHVELRTRAIDAAVREGVRAGAKQLVILGAGLDSRAFRMPELAGVRVFEVDYPATQEDKRAQVGLRPPRAAGVVYVPVDFAHDALGNALDRAGHDLGAATFWLWEGVTPYLRAPAVAATLAAIAARSATGSRLAATYATPRATSLGTSLTRAGMVAFRLMGESIVGLMSTRQFHDMLAGAGFQVLSDTKASEWAARHGRGQPRLLIVHERLVVATAPVIDGPLPSSPAA